MATTPPPPPPPSPPPQQPPHGPPDLTLFQHPLTPTTTSQRKKRTKKLLLDHHHHHIRPGKKPDPDAPKITHPCTECGKRFWSWKALFGHMRCHPERQWRGINPPPHLRRPPPPSSPPPTPTADDHDVATSLLMLAAGGGSADVDPNPNPNPDPLVASPKFECSSCKKTFGSHQALGGHRASHKNVKGCFAIHNKPDDQLLMIMDAHNHTDVVDIDLGLGLGLGLSLGHRCAVCLRVFSSGQALGGHMRCHWEHHTQASSSSSFGLGLSPMSASGITHCGPDLNLPAPLLEDASRSSFSSRDMELDLRLGL